MIQLSKPYVAFALYATEPRLTQKNRDSIQIYELAAVKIDHGKMVQLFSTFIDIGEQVDDSLSSCTGFYSEHTIGAPTIEEAIVQFRHFIQDCPLFPPNPFVAEILKLVAKRCKHEIRNPIIRSYLFRDVYCNAMLASWDDYEAMKGELGYMNMRDDALGLAIVNAALFLKAAGIANDDTEPFFDEKADHIKISIFETDTDD